MGGGQMGELARGNATERVGSMLSPAQPNPPSPGANPFSAATSPLPWAADVSWWVHIEGPRAEKPHFPKGQRCYKLGGADFQIPSAEQGENIPYLPTPLRTATFAIWQSKRSAHKGRLKVKF